MRTFYHQYVKLIIKENTANGVIVHIKVYNNWILFKSYLAPERDYIAPYVYREDSLFYAVDLKFNTTKIQIPPNLHVSNGKLAESVTWWFENKLHLFNCGYTEHYILN